MATLSEIAQGVVEVLKVSGMRRVPIQLMNHVPEEASSFVKLVIDSCATEGVRLQCVRIASDFGADLHTLALEGEGYAWITVQLDDDLGRTVEFIRL